MSNEVKESGVSRRTVLKGAAVGGVGLLGGGTLLSSCGSDAASGPVSFAIRGTAETGIAIAEAVNAAYTEKTGNEVTSQSYESNPFQD